MTNGLSMSEKNAFIHGEVHPPAPAYAENLLASEVKILCK